jgi:dihydroflavonol-4-reductase
MNLVTGATGLLGSHMLAELIRQGEKVRAFYHSEKKRAFVHKTLSLYFPESGAIMDSNEWVKGDIQDTWSLASAMEGVTRVYHTAGMVSFGQVSKKNMFETNIKGTENVVNACLEHEGIKLCHVSSIAALGEGYDGSLIDENCVLKPDKKTPAYSRSKFKGELEVWRGIHEGLTAVIVNPSVILGPGMWNSSTAAFVERVYKGLSFYPAGTVGYVDVRDVANVMYRLMNSDITAERFIVNSENLSYKEFFTIIATELGKKPPVYKITSWLGTTAVAGDFIRALVTATPRQITMQALRIASETTRYSNEKIRRRLGFDFTPIKDTVKMMCQIYLGRGRE